MKKPVVCTTSLPSSGSWINSLVPQSLDHKGELAQQTRFDIQILLFLRISIPEVIFKFSSIKKTRYFRIWSVVAGAGLEPATFGL